MAEIKPHMDAEGLAFFEHRLKNSSCYLEYGSGASTVYASAIPRLNSIFSVDTDKVWIEKTLGMIESTSKTLHVDHVDLGEVGDWGVPKDTAQFRKFSEYSVAPWNRALSYHQVPDTILIDGRFRVACFLFSLLSARIGTVIMFDDYFDRPEYFIVEEFCRVEYKVGRAAVFVASNRFNISSLVSTFAAYSLVWD